MRLLAASHLFSTVLICAAGPAASDGPLPPAREAETFRFADPNLTAELVTAEPDVVSPVCVAWDADGRMYVVEMTDYPTGPTGGRIRLLEDGNGDGRYERVTVFADELPFPTSVVPWRSGALVAAAPEIWFFKDNDGDGQADERHVLFTGFGQGNQQLRVNGLTWGIDNWVYGANGRSDGDVHAVEVQIGSNWPTIGSFKRIDKTPGRRECLVAPNRAATPGRASRYFDCIGIGKNGSQRIVARCATACTLHSRRIGRPETGLDLYSTA